MYPSLKCLAVVLGLFLAVETNSLAQTDKESVRQKLSTQVTLKLGLTTVGNLVNELSKQTGATITAEKYLQEHQISVFMPKASAVSALNAICEMHHWRWVQNEKLETVLTHLPTSYPRDFSEYPKAYRAVFPVAWLPYFGEMVNPNRAISLDTRESLENEIKEQNSTEVLTREQLLANARQDNLNRQQRAAAGSIYAPSTGEDLKNIPASFVKSDMKRRLDAGNGDNEIEPTLFPSIRADIAPGKPVPFAKWTEEEKKSSLKYLMLRFIYAQVNSRLKEELMKDISVDFFYLVKPELAHIAFRSGSLVLGVTYTNLSGGTSSSMVAEQLESQDKRDN